MKHFRDQNGKFWGVDTGQEGLIQPDWVEVSKEAVEAASAPTPAQQQQARIYALKDLLAASDHKVLPDYDRPDTQIRQQRQAWRNEIRQLNGDI